MNSAVATSAAALALMVRMQTFCRHDTAEGQSRCASRDRTIGAALFLHKRVAIERAPARRHLVRRRPDGYALSVNGHRGPRVETLARSRFDSAACAESPERGH